MSVDINKLEDSAAGRALELISATNLNKFVDFTSGLVREVFKTVIHSTLEQLEAYADLVATVSGTLADYEEKAFGDVNVTAVDYLNSVVLPSFALPAASSTSAPQVTRTVGSDNAVTFSPATISFDPTKKTELIAFFSGINAEVKSLPSTTTNPSQALTLGGPATFESLLVETTSALPSTPSTLEMSTDNLHAFAVARLRRDLKLSYEKLVTLLKLGMQKIVVTEGRINTSLTFHVASTDTDERKVSTREEDLSQRAFNWAVGGGLWGSKTLSGTIKGMVLSKSSGYSFSGSVGSSQSQVSLDVKTVNENSTAVTTLSFDITGALELKFRSDYFPSFDPTALTPPL